MRIPTMWYLRPAKPQTSLRIRAVWSEPLLDAWIFMTVKLLTEHHWEFLSLQGRLHRLVWVYTCQNATLLEITCHGSYVRGLHMFNKPSFFVYGEDYLARQYWIRSHVFPIAMVEFSGVVNFYHELSIHKWKCDLLRSCHMLNSRFHQCFWLTKIQINIFLGTSVPMLCNVLTFLGENILQLSICVCVLYKSKSQVTLGPKQNYFHRKWDNNIARN